MPRKQSHYYTHLKKRWSKRHEKLQKNLWQKHGDSLNWLRQSSKQLVAGSLASIILFTNPITAATQNLAQQFGQNNHEVSQQSRTINQLVSDLKVSLPSEVEPLNPEQEQAIGKTLSEYFHMPVAAELDGKRLHRSYGVIGAEQHLTRYPGDTIESHFDTAEEARYISSGMAPGRGAYGYFADSRESMTEQDKQREKYYIAVQTFLAPGWNEDVTGYYNFFKLRKMMVVNPENGKAIVVVIGDAGPAPFTGKHLGGSPEVMAHLERKDGGAKGPVLYFFINDPEDKVPLGPIEIQ